MKTAVLSLRTLDWDYVFAFVLMMVVLGSVTATVMTSDASLAEAVCDLVARARPMAFSWGG